MKSLAGILQLFIKLVLLVVAVLAVRVSLQYGVDWARHQDPRRRLLWDDIARCAEDTFILGDSVFCSYYVDNEDQTLWRQIERLTGVGVFNGALNGANVGDFEDAARLLLQERRRRGHGTVFLNVVPSRLLRFAGTQPVDDRNYGIEDLVAGTWWEVAERFVLDQLFLRRIELYALTRTRESYFGVGENRFRIWYEDGDLAERRYRQLLSALERDGGLRSLGWLRSIRDILQEGGMNLVVVATPLNVRLVEQYSSRDEAKWVLATFSRAHESLESFVKENAIEFVELTDDLPTGCFADLMHTNASGDMAIARALSDHIRRGN
jgi:lysophospholipase L1-like esterase